MPFHHLDENTLETARQLMARHASLRETEPVLLQNPAPGAPTGIAVAALAIIRWWAIRRALAARFALRGAPDEGVPGPSASALLAQRQ